jgi:uncharacterized protein
MRRGSALATGVAVLLTCLGSGCATYSDRMVQAMQSTSAGNYGSAIGSINGALRVGSSEDLPARWNGDRALAVLERGTLQQATESYGRSARDLSAAEAHLELLDLSADPLGTIGSYVYSDSSRTYRSPPTERLSLNAVNLLNYLARGDLDGAAVEARRFQVMRDYLDSIDVSAAGPATLGTYLAGFVFEMNGEGDRALRYYDEAIAAGPLRSLVVPVNRLARRNPYRGAHLAQILSTDVDTRTRDRAAGEILVVVAAGRVPHKVPERIPIGAAVGIAGSVLTDSIDPLRYGAAKVLVYPELVSTPSTLGTPALEVDGRPVDLEPLVDLGRSIEDEYEELKPRIMAAALTRMAVRAAAAEGVRAAGKKEGDALADALSIFAEGVLVALDRPDTRSWLTLPNRFLVARVPVDAGMHEVRVTFGGVVERQASIEIRDGGYAAIVVTEPR